ncbi:MAG: hypothetical protein COV08_03170 [Candidatus Vogelbacteria bacterium CG10_big_fil_rev_8_21_14_0_10_49_38]|uniref:YrdC-like domain-containing protein n=1 Tax=Candidatus Vogelbacteria bacterium CG10_big_fil_rev_8_21_14_0_10_49_38 TaxID=1975043 RepID=A0A2H0RH87_9BACT|nr:MAG: hypothetical protein BK006_03175 [bacterium CG10_49_38]PIR45800.1 MAG: hypothetical protein COV08_03170 [Candidatus Vogelbacteria bacterium CG10_big_fil_rev_8_21_14_0_10_49_38]
MALFAYLHRGTQTLAFRLPARDDLRALLRQTGPLVAPSANPEGYPPATNLFETQAYFGDQVSFYIETDRAPTASPSRLIRLHPDGQIEVIRP